MHLSCGIQASREPRGSSLKAALLCSPPPVHVLSYLKSGKRQLQAISRLHCLPLPIALLDDVPRDRPRDSGEEGHNLIYFGILRSRNRSSFPSMCFLVLPHLSHPEPRGPQPELGAGVRQCGCQSPDCQRGVGQHGIRISEL